MFREINGSMMVNLNAFGLVRHVYYSSDMRIVTKRVGSFENSSKQWNISTSRAEAFAKAGFFYSPTDLHSDNIWLVIYYYHNLSACNINYFIASPMLAASFVRSICTDGGQKSHLWISIFSSLLAAPMRL